MKSRVFFMPVPDGIAEAEQALVLRKLYQTANAASVISERDLVAIKLHVGEKDNTTHICPAIIRELVAQIAVSKGHAFLTETSTLYKGERENAVKHLLQAHRHGFGVDQVGAPFIMADGLNGNSEHEVTINGDLHETVNIAKEIAGAESLFVVSHPTGHVAAGLGACIKNLGMGLASRKGKMRQHSAMSPSIAAKACTLCRKCIQWCPQRAIVEQSGKAFIVADKCIGCGECLTVCRFNAVRSDWGAESGFMQKSMAEHAYGVIKNKQHKCFYFNVLINMTKDCDCYSGNQHKFIPDLGILAGTDPVAIDMATLDLTAQAHGKSLAELSYDHHDATIQIKHAAKIGMGNLDYELITIV